MINMGEGVITVIVVSKNNLKTQRIVSNMSKTNRQKTKQTSDAYRTTYTRNQWVGVNHAA